MENVLNTIFLGKRIGRKIIRTVMDAIGSVFKSVVYAVAYLWFYLLYLMAQPYFIHRANYPRVRRLPTATFDGSVRDPQELSEVEDTFDMDPVVPVQDIFGGNQAEEDDESDSIETLYGNNTDSSEEISQPCGEDSDNDDNDESSAVTSFVSSLEGDEDIFFWCNDDDY